MEEMWEGISGTGGRKGEKRHRHFKQQDTLGCQKVVEQRLQTRT